MVLIRNRNSQPGGQSEPGSERRSHGRDIDSLIGKLQDHDDSERRYAARDLAGFPQAAAPLVERLHVEQQLTVRQAILGSLLSLGGETVVDLLIPLLKSEDAALRNGVIEVLQDFPEEIAPRIASLLNDPNSDTRIFAIDVLQMLAHPSAPAWLLEVIREEEHVNVVGAAVDRLSELAEPHMREDLLALKQRFADQEYILFSVDICLSRLNQEA